MIVLFKKNVCKIFKENINYGWNGFAKYSDVLSLCLISNCGSKEVNTILDNSMI